MSAALIKLSHPPRVLDPAHPHWPRALDALPKPPLQLHVAGTLPSWTSAVAIVGTRFADDEALAFTRLLARQLAMLGVPVISGGAAGVDAAAHQGAIEAGGTTVAVLATGLSRAYPPRHAPLFSSIAEQGALISEQPASTPVQGFAFLRRNRLIAALAAQVVVVQAPQKSGALSTAVWAKRLGRRLLAIPAAPWDPRGQGCLWLLRQGADICTSAADVLSLPASQPTQLALLAPTPAQENNDFEGLSESVRLVLARVGRRGKHPDELVAGLDMGAAGVHEALLTLEISGRVRRLPDGTYVRA